MAKSFSENRSIGVCVTPHTFAIVALFCKVYKTSKRKITAKLVNQWVESVDVNALIKRLAAILQEEWEVLKMENDFRSVDDFQRFKNMTKIELQTSGIDPDMCSKILSKICL